MNRIISLSYRIGDEYFPERPSSYVRVDDDDFFNHTVYMNVDTHPDQPLPVIITEELLPLFRSYGLQIKPLIEARLTKDEMYSHYTVISLKYKNINMLNTSKPINDILLPGTMIFNHRLDLLLLESQTRPGFKDIRLFIVKGGVEVSYISDITHPDSLDKNQLGPKESNILNGDYIGLLNPISDIPKGECP